MFSITSLSSTMTHINYIYKNYIIFNIIQEIIICYVMKMSRVYRYSPTGIISHSNGFNHLDNLEIILNAFV